MKKSILIIISIVCSYTLIGQNITTAVLPPDTVYLPQIAQDGCFTVCDSTCVHLDSNVVGPFIGDQLAADHFIALAQPYFTDTARSIKGIAFCGKLWTQASSSVYDDFYLQIRDSATNTILAQTRYDTIQEVFDTLPNGIPFGAATTTYRAYFDSSIMVSGDFLVVLTVSRKAPTYLDFGGIYASRGTCLNGNTYPSPLIMWDDSTNAWEQWRTSTHTLATQALNSRNILFIYPILGVKHSNSSITQVNESNAVTLYPNPASNKVYLASPYGINEVQVYNMLGRQLETKKVNCSNYTLDVSNLEKGNYVIKVITPRGTIDKKFVKE